MPDEDEEEIDLVAKMEEARRAMPNACVVSPTGVSLGGFSVRCMTCDGAKVRGVECQHDGTTQRY